MPKPRSLLLFLAGTILVGTLLFIILKPREPSHGGHSLSYWLALPDSPDKTIAVYLIGTNAIPALLSWISYEPPAWRQHLASLALRHNQQRLFNILNPEDRATKAIKAFSILRTNALPALPALAQLSKDSKHPTTATHATYALCFLGPQALPYLVNALSNSNTTIQRTLIISTIWNLCRDGAPTNQWLPQLLKATNDPDPAVRRMATRAVRNFAPAALTNTPPR